MSMTETDSRAQDVASVENDRVQSLGQEVAQDNDLEQVTVSRAELRELERYRLQAQKEAGTNKPGVVNKSLGRIGNSIAKDFEGAGNHLANETTIGRERLIIGIKAVGSFLAKFTKPIEYLVGAVPDFFIHRAQDPNILKQDATRLLKYGLPVATVAALVTAPGITLAVGGVATVAATVGVLGYKVKKATDKVIERYRRGQATENAEEIAKANTTEAQASSVEIEKIGSENVRTAAAQKADTINEVGLVFTEKRAKALAENPKLATSKELSALRKLDTTLIDSRKEIIQSYQTIDKAKSEVRELIKANTNLPNGIEASLDSMGVGQISRGFNDNLTEANKILDAFVKDIDGAKGLEVAKTYYNAVDVAEDIARLATKALKDIIKKAEDEATLRERLSKFKEALDEINAEFRANLEKGTLTKNSLSSKLTALVKATKN